MFMSKSAANHRVFASRAARTVFAFALACSMGIAALGLSGCASDEGADNAAPQAQQEGAAEADASSEAAITVNVKVDSSAADGSVSFDGALELPEGATALDALEATELAYSAEDSQYGAFVSNIGGLANGDHGEMSGWMYKVNGEFAEVSCDALVMNDGDELVWEYSV